MLTDVIFNDSRGIDTSAHLHVEPCVIQRQLALRWRNGSDKLHDGITFEDVNCLGIGRTDSDVAITVRVDVDAS